MRSPSRRGRRWSEALAECRRRSAGSGPSPRGALLVTAHLDSVNHENPSGAAPGADDNASGAAGVLEIATCLAGHGHAKDLRFILFGGEEQGLFGSVAYVAGLGSGHGVRTAVNMDMIATINTATGPTVLIEGGPISQTLIDNLAAAAETYTGLAVQTSLHFANSDHVPFIDAGIPAVLLIEGNDSANTQVHTARDTVDRLNVDLMAEIYGCISRFSSRWPACPEEQSPAPFSRVPADLCRDTCFEVSS